MLASCVSPFRHSSLGWFHSTFSLLLPSMSDLHCCLRAPSLLPSSVLLLPHRSCPHQIHVMWNFSQCLLLRGDSYRPHSRDPGKSVFHHKARSEWVLACKRHSNGMCSMHEWIWDAETAGELTLAMKINFCTKLCKLSSLLVSLSSTPMSSMPDQARAWSSPKSCSLQRF